MKLNKLCKSRAHSNIRTVKVRGFVSFTGVGNFQYTTLLFHLYTDCIALHRTLPLCCHCSKDESVRPPGLTDCTNFWGSLLAQELTWSVGCSFSGTSSLCVYNVVLYRLNLHPCSPREPTPGFSPDEPYGSIVLVTVPAYLVHHNSDLTYLWYAFCSMLFVSFRGLMWKLSGFIMAKHYVLDLAVPWCVLALWCYLDRFCANTSNLNTISMLGDFSLTVGIR